MANVTDEFQITKDVVENIKNADGPQAALACAFDGLANLLLSILLELRDIRDSESFAGDGGGS